MANRVQDYGMDVAISRKLNSRYDPNAEAEVLGFIQQLTGVSIPPGRENVHYNLKNGQVLMQLINAVYDRTPNLSPMAQKIRRPIKFNTMSQAFKQMENIEMFLATTEAYGVPRTSLFQTVDLYECQNMAQVLNTLLQLGTEAQRCGMQGPVCGPKPTFSNRRMFSDEQMRSGEGIIGLQSGTNKLASQKGMSMGSQRHVSDIKCENMTQEGQAIIGLQMGTNQYASQKGMSLGATRHIADMKIEQMNPSSNGIIGLQMGTNKFASQKGMSMGATRHIADMHVGVGDPSSQSVISLQYGSNKGATQSGMRIGGSRHINDVKCDAQMSSNGSATLGLQMGPSQNQVASQSGMSFGKARHIMDSH